MQEVTRYHKNRDVVLRNVAEQIEKRERVEQNHESDQHQHKPINKSAEKIDVEDQRKRARLITRWPRFADVQRRAAIRQRCRRGCRGATFAADIAKENVAKVVEPSRLRTYLLDAAQQN